MRGPNAGSQFLLDQPVTSPGRHPDSDIFLDDATVSRHHVEFRLENGQFLLVDLDSLNNTVVTRRSVIRGSGGSVAVRTGLSSSPEDVEITGATPFELTPPDAEIRRQVPPRLAGRITPATMRTNLT